MKRLIFVLISIIFNCTIYCQSHPYTILISFDGFRWDYPERGITPNIENMRKNGVSAISLRPVFPSKTFPNHYSIVTGMYPENHGLIANYFSNPFTGEEYGIGDTITKRQGKWYIGEAFWETAGRNGIITASCFWPASTINQSERRPDYFHYYDHNKPYEERIKIVLDWLELPLNQRPRFITTYFHDTDSYGHDHGPNSIEINQSISRLDSLLGLLYAGLNELNLIDSTNVIIVSDHGMTEVSSDRIINIEAILSDYVCDFQDYGPVIRIEPLPAELETVYEVLQKNRNHYRVYTKDNIPDYYHYSRHPFISSIIVIADMGWTLADNKAFEMYKKYSSKGDHGYEKDHLDMHGVFVAQGPNFKSGYKTGTLWNIDIYPLLCKIFNIQPRSNIGGKLERIGFILNED